MILRERKMLRMRPDICRDSNEPENLMKNNSVIKPIAAILIMALFVSFCFDLSVDTIKTSSYAFLIICTALALIVFRKNLPGTGVFYVIVTGVLIRLTYVMYTPVWCRQHDVIDFGAGEGHAAYMEYILSNKMLPDFDPRSVWAFFQPPLHHIASAVWMGINIRLGLSEAHMHKNVQVLPLIYMCVLMVFVYAICRELNMKRSGTFVAMLLVASHPIYILMSGSINNDALSVMLTVVALYVAILWYMYPTTGKIIALAIVIGLAMSAKLSAGLLAFPVGAMMIYKIVSDTGRFKDKAKIISYILELIPFALIVVPLGLWWPVRNKILFDMPMGYIPEVGESVGGVGIVSRLFDVRTASPFLYMKSNGYAYDEYNLILATIKSSLFGEGDFANISPLVTALGWMLFATAVIVIILQLTATVRTCASSEAGPDTGIKILLGVGVAAFVIGYIAFAFSGGNLSAMDFRYSAAAAALLAVFAGLWYDRLGVLGYKKIQTAVLVLSLVFSAVSFGFYIFIGIY